MTFYKLFYDIMILYTLTESTTMHDFLIFLATPKSLITLVIPIFFSLAFIGYELMNWQTDKKYLLVFLATLALGLLANFWIVSVKNHYVEVSLHIIPLFFFFASQMHKKWKISKNMLIALGYLQVLFVDCTMAYITDINSLIMRKTDLTLKEAQSVTDSIGHWYSGVGNGGLLDALFLVFIFPLSLALLDKVIMCLSQNKEKATS
jgi:hypothetical protein